MRSLIDKMIALGFRDKEAAVYVALLQLGKAGVSEIARKSGVNRATIYSVLESLKSKDLVQFVKKGDDKYFVAEPPNRLVTRIKIQAENLEEKARSAKTLVQGLKAIQTDRGASPKIRYIESIEGLRSMQREFEEQGGDILQMVGYDSFLKLMDGYVSSEHVEALKKKDVSVRTILVTDRETKFESREGVEVITVSPSLFEVGGEMTVAGDRLVLFSYTDNIIAIEITSQAIADTARATLELAWREAKRLNNL